MAISCWSRGNGWTFKFCYDERFFLIHSCRMLVKNIFVVWYFYNICACKSTEYLLRLRVLFCPSFYIYYHNLFLRVERVRSSCLRKSFFVRCLWVWKNSERSSWARLLYAWKYFSNMSHSVWVKEKKSWYSFVSCFTARVSRYAHILDMRSQKSIF